MINQKVMVWVNSIQILKQRNLDTFSQVFLEDKKNDIIYMGGFMSKISNVLTLLQLLQSGRKYSISELSNELEVSERMIRVYKEDLEKAGIYIDTIMGPYGGYVLNQSIRMPVRKFKMKDAKLLDKYINSEKDKEIRDELVLLQDKIKGVYIGSKQEEKELNLKYETKPKKTKKKNIYITLLDWINLPLSKTVS